MNNDFANVVRQALQTVHDPTNPESRKADEWLQALVKSSAGWSLFDLISPDTDEVLAFFCANATKTKSQKDLDTLSIPVQQDLLKRLLDITPYLAQFPVSVANQLRLITAIIAPHHPDSIAVITNYLNYEQTVAHAINILVYMAEEADLLRCDVKGEGRRKHIVTTETVEQGFITPEEENELTTGDSHEYITAVRACSNHVLASLVKLWGTDSAANVNKNVLLKCYAVWVPFANGHGVTVLLNAASEGIVTEEYCSASSDVICALAESCGVAQMPTPLTQTLHNAVLHEQALSLCTQPTMIGYEVGRAVCAASEANALQILASMNSAPTQSLLSLLAQLVASQNRSLSLAAVQVWGTFGAALDQTLRSVPPLDAHISHLVRVSRDVCVYPPEAGGAGYWASPDAEAFESVRTQYYYDSVRQAARTNVNAALGTAWELVQNALAGEDWRVLEASVYMLAAVPLLSEAVKPFGGQFVEVLARLKKVHFRLTKTVCTAITTAGFSTWLRMHGTTEQVGAVLMYVTEAFAELVGHPKMLQELCTEYKRVCMVQSKRVGAYVHETLKMLMYAMGDNFTLEMSAMVVYGVAEVVHNLEADVEKYATLMYTQMMGACRSYCEVGDITKATYCMSGVATLLKNASLQSAKSIGKPTHPVTTAWWELQGALWGELNDLVVEVKYHDGFMAEVYNVVRSDLSLLGLYVKETVRDILSTLWAWSSVRKHPNVLCVLTDLVLLFATDEDMVPTLISILETYFEAYSTALATQSPPFSNPEMTFTFLNLIKYSLLPLNSKRSLTLQNTVLRPRLLHHPLLRKYLKAAEQAVDSDTKTVNCIRCTINITDSLADSPEEVLVQISETLTRILLKIAVFKPLDMLSLAGTPFCKIRAKLGKQFPDLISRILMSFGVNESAISLFLKDLAGPDVLVRLHSQTKPFRVKTL